MEPKVDGFQSSIFEKHYQKNMNFKIKDQLSKDFFLIKVFLKRVNFGKMSKWKKIQFKKCELCDLLEM